MLSLLVMHGANVDATTRKGETIYDIQPIQDAAKMPPAALKQRVTEIVNKAKKQAEEESECERASKTMDDM